MAIKKNETEVRKCCDEVFKLVAAITKWFCFSWKSLVKLNKAMQFMFLVEMLIKIMVIPDRGELRSLVRNGERSGSREAKERWC